VRQDLGAAAVEFALILPLLLLIIFGIIDFGRMLNAQTTTNQAAREAARVVMLGGDQGDAQDRVDWAVGGTGLATSAVNSACPANPDADDDARVTVTYEFTFITPVGVLAGLFDNGEDDTVGLTGKGVMPCRA
jgi:Flp pilus assembly protein TadG